MKLYLKKQNQDVSFNLTKIDSNGNQSYFNLLFVEISLVTDLNYSVIENYKEISDIKTVRYTYTHTHIHRSKIGGEESEQLPKAVIYISLELSINLWLIFNMQNLDSNQLQVFKLFKNN